jgi:hypothetical protein
VQLEVSVNTRHNALYHFGGMLEKLIRKGLGYPKFRFLGTHLPLLRFEVEEAL